MTKRKPFSAVLTRNSDGSTSVYFRPYNSEKTVKLNEDEYNQLGQMARSKGTSPHAEMRQGITDHIAKYVKEKDARD